MKTRSLLITLFTLVVFMGGRPSFNGQSQQSVDVIPKEKVIALAKQIELQQAQIEENQIAIDTKIADIGEDVRLAMFFSRRASK
jgi:hypothetical protein